MSDIDSVKSILNDNVWLGLALIQLLTKEQWEELKSGKVFVALCGNIQESVAWHNRQGRGDNSLSSDVTTDAVIKLATRRFIDRYDSRKGSPKAWVKGVVRKYVWEILRTRAYQRTIKQSEAMGLDGASRELDPGESIIMQELLTKTREVIADLDPKYRDAIRRQFPAAGNPETAFDGNLPAERVRCTRGLAMVRKAMQKKNIL